VLNGLRIPLTEFKGVNLGDLDAVELRFGAATPAGSIQLADVAFQEPSPEDAPLPSPAVTTPLPGPKRADGIAVGGVTTVPSRTVCADTAAPASSLASLRAAGGRLVATGTARDAGCAATASKRARAGKVARVSLAISRRVAGGCRYVTAGGALTAVKPCDAPLALIARGAKSWRVAARAPRGTYRVRWQAIDASGNLERAHVRALRVA
jgi:hypothetical protein